MQYYTYLASHHMYSEPQLVSFKYSCMSEGYRKDILIIKFTLEKNVLNLAPKTVNI